MFFSQLFSYYTNPSNEYNTTPKKELGTCLLYDYQLNYNSLFITISNVTELYCTVTCTCVVYFFAIFTRDL